MPPAAKRDAILGIVRRVVSLVALAACGHAGAPAARSGLPDDVARDVEQGKSANAALVAYGRFDDDPRYGARWCPREPPAGEARVEPLRNYGSWVSSNTGAVWASARPGTWLDATTRAGWWIYRQASDEWCWVPGVAKHRGHVAWRTGMGYVGWAPLPPSGRVEEVPDAAWTYTLLGMLYEPWLTTLSGDARGDATFATRPRTGEPAMLDRSPTEEEVRAARAPLVAQARAAGLTEGADLPPAQSLWAVVTKASPSKPASKPSDATAQMPPGMPQMPFPLPGVPGLGMDGLEGIDPAMIQKLLGDGGLPPGFPGMPGLPGLPNQPKH